MYTLFDKVAAVLSVTFCTIPFVAGCTPSVGEKEVVIQPVVIEEPAVENVISADEGEFNSRVMVELPENWEREFEVGDSYPNGRVVYHDKEYIPGGDSSEGVIFQNEIEFIEGGLQNTFDYEYMDCKMNNPEPAEGEDVLYIPCIRKDLKDWEEGDFGDGIKGYRSKITGAPESGEETERLYIVFNESQGVLLTAVYFASDPDEREKQYEVAKAILDSVLIK